METITPFSFRNKKRGVTLLEILIAVSILTLLGSISFAGLGSYRSRQALDASVEKSLAAFSAAHLDTISSRNDTTYGVHLKSSEVIYFPGSTYPGDGDPSTVHYVFPRAIEVANISLNGGGSTIFYKRLTGATDNYGTFDVRLKGDTSVKTTVTVNQSGSVSI